jgi:aminoglycoside 2'-N-acetyltransferase I
MDLVRVSTQDLDADVAGRLRAMLFAAFDGEFDEHDWRHALGGTHVIALDDDRIVGHGSVVERVIEIGDRPYEAGYVEAVATVGDRRGEGIATRIMATIGDLIRDGFEVGVLATGEHGFYERLEWLAWRGPTYVRTGHRTERTESDDGAVMVLRFGPSGGVDPSLPIVCDDRSGDVW